MLKKRSGGFTLIEVTIVLAITAGMVAIIFAGQRGVRSQAEFSDTVNEVASQLEAVRNAAVTSDNMVGSGTNLQQIVYGKYIYAKNNATVITIYDIIGTVTPNPAIGLVDQTSDCALLANNETLTLGTSYQITLPYGIKVQDNNGAAWQIVFHRTLCNGQLTVYDFSNNGAAGPPSMPVTQAGFNETTLPQTTAHITLTDPDGRTAQILIDGAHNGAITRKF
jgi:prepilin-type N-terminal cleavage/methylation domain-containing protein